MTSFYGSSSANNGKDALNTPDAYFALRCGLMYTCVQEMRAGGNSDVYLCAGDAGSDVYLCAGDAGSDVYLCAGDAGWLRALLAAAVHPSQQLALCQRSGHHRRPRRPRRPDNKGQVRRVTPLL
eukprot:7303856-Pyramimonas_sp.AAC.1